MKKFLNLNLKITDFNKIKPTKYRDLKTYFRTPTFTQ